MPNMNDIQFNADRSSRANRQLSAESIYIFLASDLDLARVYVKGVSE